MASALSALSRGESASSPSAKLSVKYHGLKGMVTMDSALRIQMTIKQRKQEATRARMAEASALSTLEEKQEESLHETVTSSQQWELQRLEDLNSELDLWSDHPSAYDLTLAKKRSTLGRAGTIVEPTSPADAIVENTEEEDSMLDRSDGEEGEEEEEEKDYGNELDANREAREARA